MKFKELAQMSKEEQGKKQKELELELIKLNAQVATGTPPKNSGQLKRLKKDIARIMFIKSGNKKINEKAPVRTKPGAKPRTKPKLTGEKTAENPESKTDEKMTKQNE
jgi:ribosomal protein L29